MANHASAKKRSRQNKTRNTVNSQYLSKFRTALNKFKSSVEAKNEEEIQKSFSSVNSIMAKASKKVFLKRNTYPESYPLYQNKFQKNKFFFIFFTFLLAKNT